MKPAVAMAFIAGVALSAGPVTGSIAEGRGTMMAEADSGVERRRGPLLRKRLPALLDVTISRRPFTPPKFEFVTSSLRGIEEVIAFDLRLDGPLPVQTNEGPVLYVGDVALSDAEVVEDGYVRYLAFPDRWEQLEAGAPIALGWPGRGPESKGVHRFRYELPKSR